MEPYIVDREYGPDDMRGTGTWTWGTAGVDGRFGGVHPAGNGKAFASLNSWDVVEGQQVLLSRTVRVRNHRAGVRLLRRFLRGHNQ